VSEPAFDLLIRNATVEGHSGPVDIAVMAGRIVAIGPGMQCEAVEIDDAEGALAFPGFVETHIHLDKAGILDRCAICEGTLAEAVRETANAKRSFTEDDVYSRAARVVERAILSGTTRMRSFVEIDPRAGMRSFTALKRVRADYAFAVDIELCAFAQEGLTNEPETLAMLDEALGNDADLLGGTPYTDPDPANHIRLIFDLAERHDVAVDFHLDFNLDPEHTDLPAVLAETIGRGYGGRVSIGHVTNLSAMAPADLAKIGARLGKAGIALTVLPATDLFLGGRAFDRLVPRGVAPAHLLAAEGVVTSLATNNVLNPFTPYGDASLLRMANLYANVAQLSRVGDLKLVFDMITSSAAALMGAKYGLHKGSAADIVLLDCASGEAAVREVSRVIRGWKRGLRSFDNGRPRLFRPGSQSGADST
jgi:cytosine deaminase